ncbi:MAG: hypothetical protein HY659_02090 [Rhizobiales bacterium]|nr:hypothetical protein [Hyphomicrobiales bacterium]
MRLWSRNPWSVYGLMIVGLILVIEPALPWYHFSLFWFSLGIIAVAIALYDLLRKSSWARANEQSTPTGGANDKGKR